MGRMYNHAPYVSNKIYTRYVTVLKLSGAVAPDSHQNPDLIRLVVICQQIQVSEPRSAGARATTQDFPKGCTQRNTTGLALSLEGTRRTHSRSHKSRMTT